MAEERHPKGGKRGGEGEIRARKVRYKNRPYVQFERERQARTGTKMRSTEGTRWRDLS